MIVIPPVFPAAATTLPAVPFHVAALVGMGLVGAVGHFLLIRAHHHAPATLLAPFGYTQLLVTLILGIVVFGEIPDALALAGIVLIASSGLALVLAGRKLRA